MSAQTSLETHMKDAGARARAAARSLARAPTEKKNAALLAAARAIDTSRSDILRENAAECAKAAGEGEAFLDRMRLDDRRIDAVIDGLKALAALDDPVGKTISDWERPNGLKFERVRTPIGVIAVIYESRPNVTVDAAALAVKAGNAVILRGGSECIRTSELLAKAFRAGLAEAGLNPDAAQFVDTADRAAVGLILSGLEGAIDLVIPRGGKSLVKRVQDDARVAVLGHLDGLCHVYVDRDADIGKAVAIALNSKMRRTGVCGAAETLLIDRARIEDFWPPLAKALRDAGCELRADAAIEAIDSDVAPATLDDFDTEYLAPILSVAAVDGVDGAIRHIARHGSAHTDSIVTENNETAARFLAEVDSAIVLHNASTQFADGGEFGFGAEIGIATGRLHTRGPVGLEELTTYKTIVRGDGQVRP